MGVADSRLKDRVIFVMGAPRSGTSWLASLLSVHPEIAGIATESHLFDYGVERLFDNHDEPDPTYRHLANYVARERLVDLVRDLCDGVLDGVREGTKPEARFVLEKTPVNSPRPDAEVARKAECYPDGWYLHIVRDGRAVTESLMRMPWIKDPSPEACARIWRRAVDAIRGHLAGHPRYRELSYEELRDDPLAAAADLFRWLELPCDEDVLERVRVISRERHAPWESLPARARGGGAGLRSLVAVWRASAEQALRRVVRRVRARARSGGGAAAPGPSPAQAFVQAIQTGDDDRIAELTSEDLELVVRSGAGDLQARGPEARRAVTDLAHRVFGRSYTNLDWVSSAEPGVHAFWVSGMAGDATRVDLSLGIVVREGRVVRMTLLSVGDPAGRLPGVWTPEAR